MTHHIGKSHIIIALGIAIFIAGAFFVYPNFSGKISSNQTLISQEERIPSVAPFKNFILIGWDGVQRRHLHELLDKGALPNLKKFIAEGTMNNIMVKSARTLAKPGWAEILTGYNSETTGVYSTYFYKPIPQGYTVFERLKSYFGKTNIKTIFIGGKLHNIGGRGPHKFCVNCIRRYKYTTMDKTDWWEEDSTAPLKYPGEERIFIQREGDPFYRTKESLDAYEIGLGGASSIGAVALSYLEKYKNQRFFAFFHFEEPDEQGHRYGENSLQYSNGIIIDDYWLGIILSKLKELKIYEETLVYITTAHGFDEGKREHHMFPEASYTFLATNDPKPKRDGARMDITPTILQRYGFKLEDISPPLNGTSLAR